MYFNAKIHILSTALFFVAAINTIGEAAGVVVRLIIRRTATNLPDMMNALVGYTGIITAIIRVVLISIVFKKAWERLVSYNSLVDADDHEEMGLLQKEFLKDNKSALTVEEIGKLLRVWAVVFIGVELVYDITSQGYTRIITQLSGIVNYEDPVAVQAFVSFYNNTHGFKYIGMIIAILMAVMVTGIFLNDKYMGIAVLVSAIIFLVAFLLVEMNTITIFNKSIGIVWTSVFFHIMETVGILSFSFYIRKRYRGL